LPKKEVFREPEGYFGSLEGRIAAKIDTGKDRKIIHLNTSLRWIGYAAAAMVVAALMWLGGLQMETKPTADDLLAEVSSEDLIAYLQADDIGWMEILAADPHLSLEEDEFTLDLIDDMDEATETDLREFYDNLPDDTL
jgi:hypothetical protein